MEQVTRRSFAQSARQRETKVPRCSTLRKGVVTPTGKPPETSVGRSGRTSTHDLGADQGSPQVTNHGHGKPRAGKHQQAICHLGNFKDVRFYPIFNFGHFWAALLKISGFYPTRFFRQFWADPIFSAVRSSFLAEEEALNLDFLPHSKFWPFLGRPLNDVRFYPTRNFGHFWAPS